MIDHLKPYPAYKDSGVPWLGEIPAHWNLTCNKLLLETRREIVGDRHSDFMLLSLTLQGIIPRDMENAKGKFPSDFSTYQAVHPDDFVFCLFDVDETPRTVAVSPMYGMITGAYTVFRPRKIGAKYLYYLYLSLDDRKALKPLYSGLRKVIPEDRFLRTKSPQPPLDEQATIVRYLDYVDQRIHRYIRAKRRLIELLNEQKRAIIHQAVTRGLDPDVSLKPSGVEWLGEIPAHWTLKRLKFLTSITSGQVDPRVFPYRNMILIAPNHIGGGTAQITHTETAEVQGADSGKYEVREGQVIYSKIRPNLRKAAIAPFECLCSADMYPIAVDQDQLRTGYALFLLLSAPFTKYVVDCSMRVAMPKVNRESLGKAWLWYPSLQDQDIIPSYRTLCADRVNTG